jgi:hypothetical protein
MTRNEQIIAAVTAGKTYSDVALQFGVTRNVVAGVCQRAGIKVGLRASSIAAMNAGKQSPQARRARSDALRKWYAENPGKGEKRIAEMKMGRAKWRRENPERAAEIIRNARLCRLQKSSA